MLKGVSLATKKNGEHYFRSSITFQNKHISLGSFPSEDAAHKSYLEAVSLTANHTLTLLDYHKDKAFLSFQKWVSLINFRDNGIYCKTPIYIKRNYFIYYLTPSMQLKFDVDDLFFYSKRTISKRGGHLFVADYGMQVSLLSRYGIKNFAVLNRDYRFVNGDTTDFRYRNIEIINRFYGVMKHIQKGKSVYETKIHINGLYIVGNYDTEIEAAIAYNKAAKILRERGIKKNYTLNYITELDPIAYMSLYNKIRISQKIRSYTAISDENS